MIWLSILALGIGMGFAVYMAKPCDCAHEVTEEIEDVSDENIYATTVLPEQERNHPELLKRLRETARALAEERGEITSDDVHAAFPIPHGVDPRIMGGVFHPRSDWVRTGQRQSARKDKNHGRYVSTWALRNRTAA